MEDPSRSFFHLFRFFPRLFSRFLRFITGERKKAAALFLSLLMMAIVSSPPVQSALRLPLHMRMTPGQRIQLPSGITCVLSSQDETLQNTQGVLTAGEVGETEVSLKLFGLLPLQEMRVQVTQTRTLIPGGQAVGVGMQMAGVMVVGVSAGSRAEKHIRPGDTLLKVNGQNILGAENLSTLVRQSGGQPLSILYMRSGETHTASILPEKDETGYKLGVWVRSSTAGVGTLTYYDPETGSYGALGHAVNDSDTGKRFQVHTGKLWQARIVDVKRGIRGAPGELKGSFLQENRVLGDIRKNTLLGVYGQSSPISNPLYQQGLPVGYQSSVHTGKAQILSSVDPEGVKSYDVEIVEVTRQKSAAPKSFVIRVTDEELIRKTGGIVQGMSGSPIIQDGCIIGAVTHVFVDEPLMGYGLYIEWMLEESDTLSADRAA
ncbi:MAG: SpoIVB peptidase [Clostridia bacterium]|nr:SpoIVB peptidase [Clostridia bacterium]